MDRHKVFAFMAFCIIRQRPYCEIQVRTVFEEAWSECNHVNFKRNFI